MADMIENPPESERARILGEADPRMILIYPAAEDAGGALQDVEVREALVRGFLAGAVAVRGDMLAGKIAPEQVGPKVDALSVALQTTLLGGDPAYPPVTEWNTVDKIGGYVAGLLNTERSKAGKPPVAPADAVRLLMNEAVIDLFGVMGRVDAGVSTDEDPQDKADSLIEDLYLAISGIPYQEA